MLFGMNSRLPNFPGPVAIASTWALWDAFEIWDAEMIGFWSSRPTAEVHVLSPPAPTPPPIDCSSAAECRRTCPGFASCASDSYYYCCADHKECSGTHICQGSPGLLACACGNTSKPLDFDDWQSSQTTDADDGPVLATAYVHFQTQTFIAVANWDNRSLNVTLQLDFRTLGLDPHSTVLCAPAVAGHQPEGGPWPSNSTLEVPKGGGLWLLAANHSATQRTGCRGWRNW